MEKLFTAIQTLSTEGRVRLDYGTTEATEEAALKLEDVLNGLQIAVVQWWHSDTAVEFELWVDDDNMILKAIDGEVINKP